MEKISVIQAIMAEFAERTGLSSQTRLPRRYLWTDAFAVCNYLELHRQTESKGHLETASKLVNQVHRILGCFSDNDRRSGWISGLSEYDGARHPTQCGLRIGKKNNERRVGEPFNERLEWERDGQYFHYLTKWMHALDCVARATGQPRYLQWALELAQTTFTAFTYTPLAVQSKRMYWKMSVDLSRPQVSSMGQHDPLDGLITYMQLEASARELTEIPRQLHLDAEIKEFRTMCEGMRWATDDALGIGGLLTDAFRLAQLIVKADLPESRRLTSLLRDAETGLDIFVRKDALNHPANYRLAFRELGLCIGIHAIAKLQEMVEQHRDRFSNSRELISRLTGLSRYLRLPRIIERFWLDPAQQRSDTWAEHRDINSVMLATSLAPDGYLTLR